MIEDLLKPSHFLVILLIGVVAFFGKSLPELGKKMGLRK